jgi:ATP-dependent Zn protease
LQKVSGIANAIVTKYGMSDLGLRAFSSQDEEFMAKPYSPKTEAVINMKKNLTSIFYW